MVEWSQGNTLGGTEAKGKETWARRQDHEGKNTRIRGHLHGGSAFIPDGWPDTFDFPLVNDLVKDIGRHVGPLQMVAYNALYLLIGEGDGVLREREGIHVRGQRCYGYGRIGLCEHFCPRAHVCVVDVFDNVFEAKLKGMTSISKYPPKQERKRTLSIALVTKLWYSKVVPKIPVIVFPALSNVVPLSSVWRESVILRSATLTRHSRG